MTNDWLVDPARAALLLMDFQPKQVARAADAEELVERVRAVRATADRLGVQVVHVRVAFTPQDHASIPLRNKAFAPVAAGKGNPDGAPDGDVIAQLAPADGDIVVRKTRFGAFSTTNLDHLLRGRDIDTLFLAGLSTSGVVLSTVRDAGDRDYRLFVLEDACDDPDAELHKLLLERVVSRQATLIPAAGFAAALGY